MKSFILICLALVAIQVSAAPTDEESLPTVIIDAVDSDAAKPLITSTEDKTIDVAPSVEEQVEKKDEEKKEEKSTEKVEETPKAEETPKVVEKLETEKSTETPVKSTDSEKSDKTSKKTDDKKANSGFSIGSFIESILGLRPDSDKTIEITFEPIQPPTVYEDDDIEVTIVPVDSYSTSRNEGSISMVQQMLGLLNSLNSIPSLFGFGGSEITPTRITRETTLTHRLIPINLG